ncbi:MAG: SIMPL domain-containing protein [Spirochaetaceae bacterium]|nr:SIMPL domain-containing protein [Spirochaetaceae bacterium]
MIRTARNPLIPESPRAPENGSAYGLCAVVVVVLMATLATAGCSTTPHVQDLGAPGNAQPGTVVVRAEGSVQAVPDIAVLGIGVEITQPSVAAARDRAARVTEAVIAELRRLGVEDRDMQTSRFSIQPDYQYTDEGRRRLTGYRVVHSLTVTYRDLDTVGAAIDAVSEAGGDELAFRDIGFAHSDPARHLEVARRDAVDTLHRTARQLADAANRQLGPLLEISEGVAPPEGFFPRPTTGALLKAEAVDTPISLGSDNITVTVRGVFGMY